jgi:hypothetical protein
MRLKRYFPFEAKNDNHIEKVKGTKEKEKTRKKEKKRKEKKRTEKGEEKRYIAKLFSDKEMSTTVIIESLK